MALYTREDFAKVCGVSGSYITMYIKRDKIFVENGMINDKQRDNADFLKKQLNKLKDKKEIVISDSIPDNKGKSVPLDQEQADNYDLGLKKKAIDIEKAEVEVRLLGIKEEKLRGELIPVEVIKSLFTQHSQSILTEFKNSVDNFITSISKRKNLSINEIAEIRGELFAEINVAVDKAVETSKKNVNNILKDFSTSRGVGEHD